MSFITPSQGRGQHHASLSRNPLDWYTRGLIIALTFSQWKATGESSTTNGVDIERAKELMSEICGMSSLDCIATLGIWSSRTQSTLRKACNGVFVACYHHGPQENCLILPQLSPGTFTSTKAVMQCLTRPIGEVLHHPPGWIHVNMRHFYNRMCNIFDIFVKQLMLPAMCLANPRDISQNVDCRCCQHANEDMGFWF